MKVLIVDDSALMRAVLKTFLENEKDIHIIGEATNGERAVKMTKDLSPDLIIMDIKMPVMDGLEATQRIMKVNPAPIIIFSGEANAENSFNAINLGAADVMQKPDIDQINDPVFQKTFLTKIRTLAKKHLYYKAKPSENPKHIKLPVKKFKFIVIGASTGGPAAVREVLSGIPGNFSVGIALVQHLEKGFDSGYASWLNEATDLKVKLAEKRNTIIPGEVIIAPTEVHLTVDGNLLVLDDGPKVLNQKPSVDVLFETAADSFRENLLGVLLTGMGSDGANGCVSILSKGGTTLVQDQATSAIFGMPKAAIELGGASKVLPLSDISRTIISMVK